MAAGADCPNCPLAMLKRTPVPPEGLGRHARIDIVGEAPGRNEERLRRPFVGKSGKKLDEHLQAAGIDRSDTRINNAILCFPVGGDMEKMRARLQASNARRRRDGKPALKDPVECCAPRLRAQVRDASALLVYGKTAFRVLVEPWLTQEPGTKATLQDFCGFPLRVGLGDGRLVPTVATYHPAYGLRQPRWLPEIQNHLKKLVRHAAGELRWHPPDRTLVNPPIPVLRETLREWLAAPPPAVALDIETDGLDRQRCKVRCIGVGTPDLVVVIGVTSVTGKPIHDAATLKAYLRLLQGFVLRAQSLTTNNGILFDAPILRRLGLKMDKHFDAALGHAIWRSELPANLDFIASSLTDAPRHKNVDHEHWQSDEELYVYNAADVRVQAATAPRIKREVVLSGQQDAFRILASRRFSPTPENPDGFFGGMAGICAGLNRAGFRIDTKERDRHDRRLREKMQAATAAALASLPTAYRARLDAWLGKRSFTLGSHPQVRWILYSLFGLSAPRDRKGRLLYETSTGDPSTEEDAVLALIDASPPPEAEGFLFALLDFRKAQKLRGYCKGRTRAEYDAAVQAYNTGAVPFAPPKPTWWIGDDHRVRADWGPWAVTSRLTCSRPNLMNLPRPEGDGESLRSMYVASPGHVFIGVDYAQLELRLIALITQDEVWLEAFRRLERGEDKEIWDPHRLNVRHAFDLAPSASVSKLRRQLLKTMIYAWCYGCAVKKLLQLVKAERDPDGSRPFADLDLDMMGDVAQRLGRYHPAVLRWQDSVIERWQNEGIRSLLFNRRRDFLDTAFGEEHLDDQKEAMLNHQIQSSGADIVNEGTFRALEVIPWGASSPGAPGPYGPGLVQQNHDSLIFEVREDLAETLAPKVEAAMVIHKDGMVFPTEVKIGRNWAQA